MSLHGHQQQRFFHGYYDGYCYLPLYIFCGEHLLCARLRPANQDAAAGCVEEVQRLVAQIRQAWPKVQMILRGDSGFCRDALMSWCESNRVDYVLGLARNSRREGSVAPWLASGSGPTRGRGGWWPRRRCWGTRRILGFLWCAVTSLRGRRWGRRALYEDVYCARGEMENRIKEQLSLFADRVSTETMRANQMRLYLSGVA